MRVLHLYSGNLFGGVETLLLTLARNTGRCPAMEIDVALCYAGRLSRELETIGRPAHLLPTARASRPHTVLRARLALGRLLGARQFDCVVCHSQWTHAIFGPIVRRASLPLVLWVHGALSGRHWSEVWAARTLPDLAICTSHFTARTVPKLYRAVPVTVIHPPVEPAAPSSASERRRVRDELATPFDAVVIIQPSRTEAWKGHSVIIDALGHLRDLPDWIWWQVGGAQRPHEEKYLALLRERAEDRGIEDRVRFVGERSDVGRLLAAADVHCQANLRPEPFGIALVEALAVGLPVVTVAMGGAVEIVDESCGMLASPRDPHALASALRRLVCDSVLRARLSAAAAARARHISDPTAQMRRLHCALQTIVQGQARQDVPEVPEAPERATESSSDLLLRERDQR
jgi:glycosyltransferase involved in cell wall biosynthesis